MVQIWTTVGRWVREVASLRLSSSIHNETYGVKRSTWGRLSIRFEGGPSYPDMVDDLERASQRYGHLISNGACLTGEDWIQLIVASGGDIDMVAIHAIRTLIPAAMKAGGGA